MNDSTSFEIANFPWELKQFQISIFKCFSNCEKSKSFQTPPKLFVAGAKYCNVFIWPSPTFFRTPFGSSNIAYHFFCKKKRAKERKRGEREKRPLNPPSWAKPSGLSPTGHLAHYPSPVVSHLPLFDRPGASAPPDHLAGLAG